MIQLVSRDPATQAAVSASRLSLGSAVIGVGQGTITWMEETRRAVSSAFATGIQPAATALGTTASIKSPLTSIGMWMAGRLSKEMGLLQSSTGPSATGMCSARHDDRTLCILWLLPNFSGTNR